MDRGKLEEIVLDLAFGLIPTVIIFALVYKTFAFAPIMELSDGVMNTKTAKLSYKGYIWKTWDGWIPVGVNNEGGVEKWYFTVKDGRDDVVECIKNGKHVQLHYKDTILMPFRYGNSHQIDGCEEIK